jgi:hypothetical protein
MWNGYHFKLRPVDREQQGGHLWCEGCAYIVLRNQGQLVTDHSGPKHRIRVNQLEFFD